jgi:formate/nitrite transporter FocA (FNT family)
VLTFLGHAVGAATFPENPFLSAILYPLGVVYIILGGYQLYTENTLPPVALVLSRVASLPMLLRVWSIAIVGNVIGAALGAYLLAHGQVLSPEALEAGVAFTADGLETGRWAVFNRSMFAGWLVAGVVWLSHAARDTVSRFLVVYLIFYLIAAAELYHVVTAACEALFFVFLTGSHPVSVLTEYWIPIFLGNTIGGVFLFRVVNYTRAEQQRFPSIRILSLRELLFSWRGSSEHLSEAHEAAFRYFEGE